MEKWKKRTVELIASLLFGSKESVSSLPYYPQKTVSGDREEAFFGRTIPEKKGVSSLRLYNMLCELEGERRAGVHSLLVLHGDEVICECSSPGYSTREWHISHSMSKTVLGMIIGRLIDDGRLRLDTTLSSIFPEIPYRDRKFPLITVDHLLSMTSGVDFAEAGAITERDWTLAFFSATVRFPPGSKFSYNSMNSYILGRVAERVTGRSLGSLADELLFAPLGINKYLWEKGPEGTEKGGWGLYMTPESWAKVGYMLMCGGEFMGRQILSPDWVATSTVTKAISPESTGSFNYAYHMWTGRDSDEILFNGMLGQNVWLCPRNNIIVVITSGNNEFFSESPALEIIRKYLGGRIEDRLEMKNARLLREKEQSFFDSRRWVCPRRTGRGLLYTLGIMPRASFDPAWEGMLGSYDIAKNNASIMPLILRIMQNNLATAIEKIELFRYKEDLILRLLEGGEEHTVRVGLYGYKDSICYFHGEKYLLRAMGEARRDFQGGAEYRIEILFPETANTRMLTLTESGEGRLSVRLRERPNHRLAENVLRRYRETNGTISFAADMLERRIGERELYGLIERAFAPTIVGVSSTHPDAERILWEASLDGDSEPVGVKIIRALIERLFRENGK